MLLDWTEQWAKRIKKNILSVLCLIVMIDLGFSKTVIQSFWLHKNA